MLTRRNSCILPVVAAFALLAPTARAQTPIYGGGGRTFHCQCMVEGASGQRYLNSTDFGPYQSKAACLRNLHAAGADYLAYTCTDDALKCMQACPKLGPPRTTTPTTTTTTTTKKRGGTSGLTLPGVPTYGGGSDSVTVIGNAVLGALSIFGSYMEQRQADAEFSARQQQALEEARREADEALERGRIQREQEFEASKQETLSQMRGPRPTDLQMKGTAPGSLQMKTMNDVAEDERRAAEDALGARMQARVARLRSGATPSWSAEPASPPPAAPSGQTTLPPMIGASGGTAYSTDTGKVVNVPAGTGQGATAYSVDTGQVVPASGLPAPGVSPPGPPQPAGAGATAYSTDTGAVVATPRPPADTAYSTDTGKVVTTAPPPAPDARTGGSGTARPASTGGPNVARVGPGPTPAVTKFDGTYRATIVVQTPAGVVPEYYRREFLFSVVTGTSVAMEVQGTVGATGQLTSGRSQMRLRVGPSAELVVPLSGIFVINGGFRVTGSTPCAKGICTVTVTGVRVR